MESDRKTFLACLAAALVAGILVAGSAWLVFPRASAPGIGGGPARWDDLELLLRGQEKRQDELAVRFSRVEDRLLALETAATRPQGFEALPKEYVRQVEAFFEGAEAEQLLSAEAKKSGPWHFAKPAFIEARLVSVVYSDGLRTGTMICKLEVLDYYDLQVSVVWDSMEGNP